MLYLAGFQVSVRQDPTTNYGVSCHWASEKSMFNVVNTLASFMFLFSLVARTSIKSGLSSQLSLVGPCTKKLAALERLKNSP